jgi:peroxiredoxin
MVQRSLFPIFIRWTIAGSLMSTTVLAQDAAKPSAAKPPASSQAATNAAGQTNPQSAWTEVKVPATSDVAALFAFIQATKQLKPATPEQYAQMQRGLREASKKVMDLVKDPKSADYAKAELEFVSSSVLLLGNDGPDAQQKTVERFKEYLSSRSKLTSRDLQMIVMAGQNLEQLEDLTIARAAYQQFADILTAKKDPSLDSMIAVMNSNVKRLELIDKKIELKGTTTSGEAFNIESLRGKYVLVCFWGSFSPPAIQEMNRLRKPYETYRDKGFEIVSICMDDDREKGKAVLAQQQWPWPQLWDRVDEATLLSTSLGISAVPSMIFVDNEGTVTSVDVNSAILQAGLADLFSPQPAPTGDESADKAPETPAESKPKG